MTKLTRSLALVLTFAGIASTVYAADTDPNKNLSAPDKAYRQVQTVTAPPINPLKQYEDAMRPIYDLTIQETTAAIKKNPNDASLYAKRAAAHAAKKDFQKALPDYDASLKLDPAQDALYGKRAIANFMTQNYDKSWNDVHEAQKRGVELPAPFLDALKATTKRQK